MALYCLIYTEIDLHKISKDILTNFIGIANIFY